MQFQKNQPAEKSGVNERFRRFLLAKAASVEEDQRLTNALLAKNFGAHKSVLGVPVAVNVGPQFVPP